MAKNGFDDEVSDKLLSCLSTGDEIMDIGILHDQDKDRYRSLISQLGLRK